MRVLKFGGTSVKNAETMQCVASILSDYPAPTVVVLSATAGTTDSLISLVTLSAEGQLDEALKVEDMLNTKHFAILKELGLEEDTQLIQSINAIFSKLNVFINGVYYLRESTNRVKDAVVSCGELLSTHIFSAYLKRLYPETLWYDIRNVLKTDDRFGTASPDIVSTQRNCKEKMEPLLSRNRFIITQGFIGSTADGLTTTLGRGGSDYTAALLGNVLEAEAIEIWTEVNGVMTADPHFIPKAFSQRDLSFKEAAELSYFGTKVLHPSMILPAMEKNIPVLVKNAMNPEDPGTMITHDSQRPGQVKAIAFRKNITTVTIESSRMLLAYGFLERIFEVFARYQVSVDLVSTSEISVSLTLDTTHHLDPILSELKNFSFIKVSEKMAIVSLVGEDIKSSPKFLKKAFQALDGLPIEMISFGASNVNLSVVIPENHLKAAVTALHKALFE